MKLVLTGGGTGGHIYPALEVGRVAAERGAELRYLGSLRGQEGAICQRLGISFEGFASEPIYNPKSIAGLRAIAALFRAAGDAKKALRRERPDAVFSTGGYSSGPVVSAARSLGIPYVLHANDTVPSKAVRMFVRGATQVTCTFRETVRTIPRAVRTGHPIRNEIREAAARRQEESLILVVGGSGGARFLNQEVPKAAPSVEGVRWLHATGKAQFGEFQHAAESIDGYQIVPYLEAEAMADAYSRAMLVVARSGSSLAEFAALRLPSVLVPLPTSADDHQLHNAREFEAMGAATVCEQGKGNLAEAIQDWVTNGTKRQAAQKALAEWDIPDATARLATIIEEAARKHA